MAWPVCDHQLDRVAEPTLYPRETWLNQLAHTQWSLAELGDGTVWRRFEAKAKELCG